MKNTFVELIIAIKRKTEVTETDYLSTCFVTCIEIRKELIQKCTTVCVDYGKYLKKKSYKFISELLGKELKPLEKLIIASNSIDYFDDLREKGEVVPSFRIKAADELFVISLDAVAAILLFCNKIDKPLDTGLLLSRLEIPNWPDIRPLEFYLTQLKRKLNLLRGTLRTMFKLGKSNSLLNTI